MEYWNRVDGQSAGWRGTTSETTIDHDILSFSEKKKRIRSSIWIRRFGGGFVVFRVTTVEVSILRRDAEVCRLGE